MARGELAVRRDDAQLLLPGDGLFAQFVPALVELALVLVGPFLGHMVRRVGRAGREVDEERFIGCQRLLLRHPGHRLVGHVRHEVVALFGRLFRLDRRGPLVERGIPLVRLAADKAVEVLEPAAAGGPCVERSDRARLPHRHFVAFAELRGRVTVELQGPGQRRDGIGQYRAVARRAGGDFGDAAHACGVVVAPGQQRRPRRGAEGGGVEAVVLQPGRRQLFQVRRLAGAAKGAVRTEPGVVDQDEQHVGRALGRAQLLDWREFGVRVPRVIRDQPGSLGRGDREV